MLIVEGEVLAINFALLGTGRIADTALSEALKSANGATLWSVLSRDEERAHSFAERHGAQAPVNAYSDLDRLLQDPELNAVVIATPDKLHVEQAIAAAAAGKHVLTEKPMATTVEDCQVMVDACADAGVTFHVGGSYVCMEGPQFSTRAESELYRSWGATVIGMTNLPEAKLAREAELCYATVAMVTDFDCWHPDHNDAEVADILKVLTQNAGNARSLVKSVVPAIAAARPRVCSHGCDRSLDTALITAAEARDPARLAKLDAVAGRVLGEG